MHPENTIVYQVDEIGVWINKLRVNISRSGANIQISSVDFVTQGEAQLGDDFDRFTGVPLTANSAEIIFQKKKLKVIYVIVHFSAKATVANYTSIIDFKLELLHSAKAVDQQALKMNIFVRKPFSVIAKPIASHSISACFRNCAIFPFKFNEITLNSTKLLEDVELYPMEDHGILFPVKDPAGTWDSSNSPPQLAIEMTLGQSNMQLAQEFPHLISKQPDTQGNFRVSFTHNLFTSPLAKAFRVEYLTPKTSILGEVVVQHIRVTCLAPDQIPSTRLMYEIVNSPDDEWLLFGVLRDEVTTFKNGSPFTIDVGSVPRCVGNIRAPTIALSYVSGEGDGGLHPIEKKNLEEIMPEQGLYVHVRALDFVKSTNVDAFIV
jgi:hypothetical protein